MPNIQTLPLLLSILFGWMIGFLGWSFFQVHRKPSGDSQDGVRDVIIIGMLVLAAFASGVFIAIILMTLFS